MNLPLQDKVIVVTGGAGLIGRSLVRGIVEQGGVGIVADVNEIQGARVVNELREELRSSDIEFCTVDITSKDSIAAMIEAVSKKCQRIDALVNNAYPRNKNYGRHFFDVEYADFCENVNLHLGGYFLMSQQMAKFFAQQKFGNIINMSSIYGVIAPRFEVYDGTAMTMPVEYAAIKSAILQLTRYMAKYLKGTNIRVNAVSPGGVLDGQPEPFLQHYRSFCLNKGMLDKEDLCGTVLYLLSDLSACVNGQNIIIDDGYSL